MAEKVKKKGELPFKVGQIVESRTFEVGYRGAWFRSLIRAIRRSRHTELWYDLAFLDFPDEKRTWTRVYQRAYDYDKDLKCMQGKPAELMIRPAFPPVYRESEAPDVNTISEAIVVVNDNWKVGDLVDWWTDDCYWTGRIRAIDEEGGCQIALLPRPKGEGMIEEANCKDFRPSLDWSLEHGWTDYSTGCCARVVFPVKSVDDKGTDDDNVGAESSEMGNEDSVGKDSEGDSDYDGTAPESPLVSRASSSSLSMQSHKSKDVENQQQPLSETVGTTTTEQEKNTDLDLDGDASSHDTSGSSEAGRDKGALDNGGPPGFPNQPMSFEAEETPATVNGTLVNDGCSDSAAIVDAQGGGAAKKRGADEEMRLNSMFSDTIEASVLDLEEILQRVKWMKGMLQDDDGKASSNASRPPWKFLEHRT